MKGVLFIAMAFAIVLLFVLNFLEPLGAAARASCEKAGGTYLPRENICIDAKTIKPEKGSRP